LDEPVYHVLLEGSKVGPYNRRTIVGMRIRGTLTSDHGLIASDGTQLTVADLVKLRPRDNTFQPNRSGSYSLVQATYSASLVGVNGPGAAIPRFRGEIEARVQSDVLRIAGRFRHGLFWKEDRVKLPLKDMVHARVRGNLVDVWLRRDGTTDLLQITLELFTPQTAGEFVDWLPHATPLPHGHEAAPVEPAYAGHSPAVVWSVIAATALALAVVALLLVIKR
jgi:hypothetical protein